METLLLKPKNELSASIRIYDEVVEHPIITNNFRHCFLEGYGASFSLEHLVKCFKFPFRGDNEECSVVETIVCDENLLAQAEFYPYEEIEF